MLSFSFCHRRFRIKVRMLGTMNYCCFGGLFCEGGRSMGKILGFLAILLFLNLELMGQVDRDSEAVATLGAGCFWCVEAVYERLDGVVSAQSGYSGGHVGDPSYEEVCTGNTGHAEVVQVHFRPEVISYAELLKVFFSVHDPTTLNRQGGDVGTQYRSVVFYHDEQQRQEAERVIQKLEVEGIWKDPIVTALDPIESFFSAENFHQEYFENNPNQGYCRLVVRPKVEKFEKTFKSLLKQAD